MDFLAYSHGQIQSKVWLCEYLEPYIPDDATIAILGSWYNILGFMLLTRNPKKYQSITGFDVDAEAIIVADKLCQAWMIGEDTKLHNINENVNACNLNGYNVVINCSVEHMEADDWYHNLSDQCLICLQSSNVIDPGEPWLITNPTSTLDEFAEKYKMSKCLVKAEKKITYNTWGYSRFMLIGMK